MRFGAQQEVQDEIRETFRTLALDTVPEELLGDSGSWSLWTVAQQTLLLKQKLIDCFSKEPTVLQFPQKLLEITWDFKTFLITSPKNSSWRPFSVQFNMSVFLRGNLQLAEINSNPLFIFSWPRCRNDNICLQRLIAKNRKWAEYLRILYKPLDNKPCISHKIIKVEKPEILLSVAPSPSKIVEISANNSAISLTFQRARVCGVFFSLLNFFSPSCLRLMWWPTPSQLL